MIMKFNDLRDRLKEFLKPFREDNQVVTREHIIAFFESLQANKRRKLD